MSRATSGEGIFYEEVVTTQPAFRPGLLHRLPPAAADAREEGRGGRPLADRDGASNPPCATTISRRGQMPAKGDPVTGRVPLLTNADV